MVTSNRDVCFLIKLQAMYLCNLQFRCSQLTHNIDSFADGSEYITCIILLEQLLFCLEFLHYILSGASAYSVSWYEIFNPFFSVSYFFCLIIMLFSRFLFNFVAAQSL